MPPSAPGRGDLAALAQRLGNVVQDVLLDTGELRLPTALAARVLAMKGAPLTEVALLDLMLAAAGALPGGGGHVSVGADRLGDGKGVIVSLGLRAGSGRGPRGGLLWTAHS